MPTINISHTGLCVSDLEASLRFYTEGLGFELADTYTAGNEVASAGEVSGSANLTSQMITKDGLRLELLWWATPGATGTPSTTRNQRGLTHLSFSVDDIDHTEAKLVALGARVVESTRTHFGQGATSIDLVFLTDPDGTRIELVNWGATE
jgi:catechol 2,3-dioxygenase-like lactoylglutathione lyase family enzyme